MKPSRLAAVGAFVLGGAVLFAVGLFYIGERRLLFGNTFLVFAEFSEIAGLDKGGVVRVAGMHAGEVEIIQVPAGPSGKFRVRMRVRDDLKPLIRQDSVASIQNDGLVGNKFVQIEPGTDSSAEIVDGGTIQSREPFNLADLLEQLSGTIDTVDETIFELKADLEEALDSISAAARTADGLIDDVGRDARAMVTAGNRISKDLETIIAGVRSGKGTVGQLLTDDAFYQSAKKIAADAERTMANVRQATEEARGVIADFRTDDGPAKGLAANLQETLGSARNAMNDLAETTEALKRNFLFRGYFNRRGYFDLEDLTVQQYRQGTLETKDRRALRIWLRADVLFENDANGGERLSEGGRARIDSAMSQFVRYPKTSPFVVEGYAEGLTTEERFRVSRARAAMVRDYVVGKFGLDAQLVAIMPMGNEAEGAPGGDKWNGVALAMFVPTSAL
jgi:phospholipid/cholesterol/gamma-HCH transport system substrate-binding protein